MTCADFPVTNAHPHCTSCEAPVHRAQPQRWPLNTNQLNHAHLYRQYIQYLLIVCFHVEGLFDIASFL